MSDKNPLDQLGVLGDKLREISEEMGFELEGFAVIPSLEQGGTHMAQAILRLDPNKVFVDPEQRAIDKQFEEIALMERVDRDREKHSEAGDKLKQTLAELQGSEGIGLDDVGETGGGDQLDS